MKSIPQVDALVDGVTRECTQQCSALYYVVLKLNFTIQQMTVETYHINTSNWYVDISVDSPFEIVRLVQDGGTVEIKISLAPQASGGRGIHACTLSSHWRRAVEVDAS